MYVPMVKQTHERETETETEREMMMMNESYYLLYF